MADYKYKFSFVIPVYNVEDYLAETVESILAQTMDFASNCEIIFVNDGSTDASEEVCLRYQQQFPNNIKYISQKNTGPGAARNRGAEAAEGKYINPIDSDDKLSPNTLSEVYKFFEKHYDEIDLVGIKWEFFEARLGPHPLNYKFDDGDRVIDLKKDFNYIQGSCAPAFFKCEVFEQHKFDPSVGRYAEDARFMGEVLLEKQKFGVVSKPTYYYRKRHSQTSSQDSTRTDKFWYTETPKRIWYDLIDYARAKTGEKVPRFIQYMVMYEFQWRLKQPRQDTLNSTELKRYQKLIFGLLDYIDDDIIMMQRNLPLAYKLFALSKKYNESVLASAQWRGSKAYYRDSLVYDSKASDVVVHLDWLEASGSNVTIEGYFSNAFEWSGTKLELRINGEPRELVSMNRPHKTMYCLGQVVDNRRAFRYEGVIKPDSKVEICFTRGDQSIPLPLLVHRHTYLSPVAPLAYRVCGDFLVRRYPTKLTFAKHSRFRHLGYEFMYWAALLKRLKLRVTLQMFREWRQKQPPRFTPGKLKWVLISLKALARNLYVIGFRLAYFVARPLVKKPIWIISDRVTDADDSGEILFKYLACKKDVPASVYFVISKSSSDFARLKRYGKVLNYYSLRYKLMFMLADKVISSEASDHIINAFGGRLPDLLDLLHFDFVFLQHGVIRDDISNWVNRWDKNIKLFVTSAKPEYESIVNGDYGYDASVVKLTGLLRYDNLLNDPKSKIILAPTWRRELAGPLDARNGHRLYNPNFKQSIYFKFWQNLMNDERLIRAMKKHNLTGELYLHHSFRSQTEDFSNNDLFKIMPMPHDWPKAKCEGNLLVTDFSSVAIDFAYLNKPVVYAQFDADTYYQGYVGDEGYFSFERDGFGPVTYDSEATVKEMIKLIESDYKMQPEYQNRVDKFFAHRDKDNSKRVYEAILDTDKLV